MAVVLRFNVVIARKDRVGSLLEGGVGALRESLRGHQQFIAEDDHLIIEHGMAAPGLGQLLRDGGLKEGIDFVCGTMATVPQVPWLRDRQVLGWPVCWHAQDEPGYIVDTKPPRVLRKWLNCRCESCGETMVVGAGLRAVEEKEALDGPLAWVSDNPSEMGPWRVHCDYCQASHSGDWRGRLTLR